MLTDTVSTSTFRLFCEWFETGVVHAPCFVVRRRGGRTTRLALAPSV
jgi:hypothetical protein